MINITQTEIDIAREELLGEIVAHSNGERRMPTAEKIALADSLLRNVKPSTDKQEDYLAKLQIAHARSLMEMIRIEEATPEQIIEWKGLGKLAEAQVERVHPSSELDGLLAGLEALVGTEVSRQQTDVSIQEQEAVDELEQDERVAKSKAEREAGNQLEQEVVDELEQDERVAKLKAEREAAEQLEQDEQEAKFNAQVTKHAKAIAKFQADREAMELADLAKFDELAKATFQPTYEADQYVAGVSSAEPRKTRKNMRIKEAGQSAEEYQKAVKDRERDLGRERVFKLRKSRLGWSEDMIEHELKKRLAARTIF